MTDPMMRVKNWIDEEQQQGNPFPGGAILSTANPEGQISSRMLGTKFSKRGYLKFHTSGFSRKVRDIEHSNEISLSFSYQQSLRSISIEGSVSPLSPKEIKSDWLDYDEDFRRQFCIFGRKSGTAISSPLVLEEELEALPSATGQQAPDYFVGYELDRIKKVVFYSVQPRHFALCESYVYDAQAQCFIQAYLAP